MRPRPILLAILFCWLAPRPTTAQSSRPDRAFCRCLRAIQGKVVANEATGYFDTVGCFIEGKLRNCRLQPVSGRVVITSERSGEPTFLTADSITGSFKGWLKRDRGLDGPYRVLITAPGYADFHLAAYSFHGGICCFEVLLGDSRRKPTPPSARPQ